MMQRGVFKAEDRAVAVRDGTRRENATSGYGDIDIDVKDERVAPWNI